MLSRTVALAVLALAVACGTPTAQPSAQSPVTSLAFTDGIVPVATLPDSAAPIRAAFRGTKLVMLARGLADGRLNLQEYDPGTNTFVETRLDLEDAGVWAGLGVDNAGVVWVAIRDKVLRIDAGLVETYPLPPVQYPLPSELQLGQPSGAPVTPIGFATSLAVAGDSIVIGRTDAVELVVMSRATRHLRQLPLPPGTGDIAELVPGPNGSVIFTVTRSGRTPGLLNDVVGVADPATGLVRTFGLPARGLSASPSSIAVGGASINVLDADGRPSRPSAFAERYDVRRLALRSDGTIVVRVNGSHELAIIDHQGREAGRIQYAVPIVKLSRGPAQPYNSSLAFAVPAPDRAVWFSLDGRPELYRVP